MAVASEPPLECGKNEIFTTYSSFLIQNPRYMNTKWIGSGVCQTGPGALRRLLFSITQNVEMYPAMLSRWSWQSEKQRVEAFHTIGGKLDHRGGDELLSSKLARLQSEATEAPWNQRSWLCGFKWIRIKFTLVWIDLILIVRLFPSKSTADVWECVDNQTSVSQTGPTWRLIWKLSFILQKCVSEDI